MAVPYRACIRGRSCRIALLRPECCFHIPSLIRCRRSPICYRFRKKNPNTADLTPEKSPLPAKTPFGGIIYQGSVSFESFVRAGPMLRPLRHLSGQTEKRTPDSAIECPKRQPSASFRILGCNWPIVVGRHLKRTFLTRADVAGCLASASSPRLCRGCFRAGCIPRDRSTFPGLDSLC
jgi:hypothetical protein